MWQYRIVDRVGTNFRGTHKECIDWMETRLSENVPEDNEVVRVDERTLHYKNKRTGQIIQTHEIIAY